MTTTTTTPAEAAQLVAAPDPLDAAYAHVVELRRELQRCEDGVQRLVGEASRQLAGMWAIDAGQQH